MAFDRVRLGGSSKGFQLQSRSLGLYGQLQMLLVPIEAFYVNSETEREGCALNLPVVPFPLLVPV